MNVTFRNKFVHHNLGDGIWFDGNHNANALVEQNIVEDNGRTGVTIEISTVATIRSNTCVGVVFVVAVTRVSCCHDGSGGQRLHRREVVLVAGTIASAGEHTHTKAGGHPRRA